MTGDRPKMIGPSGHIGQTHGEFSVCQFFANGLHEYVRRYVDTAEAVEAARTYSSNPAARVLGTTVRVIITDGGDYCCWEWKRGEGIVFPPELARPDA